MEPNKPVNPIALALKERFPWLGTDDDANGSDTVDALNTWYAEVQSQSPKPATLIFWISAIVPEVGADTYNGVRIAASASELEAFQDLNEWLKEPTSISPASPRFIPRVKTLLLKETKYWNVESCEVR